jgi:hypothetical protein
MTGCWNGKVAGYLLNILIFMLFVLIFNIIFVMRTKIVAPFLMSLSTHLEMSLFLAKGLNLPWRYQDVVTMSDKELNRINVIQAVMINVCVVVMQHQLKLRTTGSAPDESLP